MLVFNLEFAAYVVLLNQFGARVGGGGDKTKNKKYNHQVTHHKIC